MKALRSIRPRGPRRAVLVLIVGLIFLGSQWLREGTVRVGDLVIWPRQPAADAAAQAGKIEQLFEQGRSDVMVAVEGWVERVLSDDNEGSRHQRFILRLSSGHTLLVAHNLDLAARVPLARGDRVEVRGEYEWNERGGVLHWTHRDPQRRREGGWIKLSGQTYR